jgi:hypothetical protein
LSGTHSRPILSDLLVMAGLVPAIQKRRRWRLPGRARVSGSPGQARG